ncbi:MAG: aldehyde dehydrogenase family protein [Myxococcales bacterium]|nr:aldehyde dehydrogenase family protein [Myxococcales bacterium]
METQIPRPVPTRIAASSPIPCHDPATGMSLGEVAVVSPEEVRARVRRAKRAQESWGKTPFAERRRVLGRLLEKLLDEADDLVEVICRDSGKTRENALLGEIWPLCEKLRHTIATGERDLAPERVSPGLLLHKVATIEYPPLGVIGVICPWNFPLQNILGPTIPALMAGCAVVVKVSEWTSWSAARFQKLVDDVLHETGHSTDLIQIVTGYAETGAALCNSGVDKIIFTGSMPNGRRVLKQCAETLTPAILELGGKDPMIVCDDADLPQAVHAALAGVFISSGQMCLAAERIYVFEAIHDRFVEEVLRAASSLRQGPPLAGAIVDLGAMTMPGQLDLVQRLVDDAVQKGARLLLGGRRGAGQFYPPTILDGVDATMAIAREETFGPVMAIAIVRDEEEAIARANDSEFGLGGTVFTRDPARARRFCDRLVAGSTVVNDFGLAYMANALPFGGVRGSGFGRLNGREGIRACCNARSVMRDRFPLHQPVKLYPVGDHDYARTRGVLDLLYRRDLFGRVKGGVAALRAAFKK